MVCPVEISIVLTTMTSMSLNQLSKSDGREGEGEARETGKGNCESGLNL
jgi:hypothetical protein